ncbi:hypothetical protein [Bernardetia sp.]|uniref:hypothetical protein n=1 Tax=Bernardetia sp. TaxID=1937974 RepID=UPI0025C08AC8|nr:hypothetical protein [Bernardetia sp.]
MLHLRLLTGEDDFLALKKGDQLAVEFKKPVDGKNFMTFEHTLINVENEVIICRTNNWFFNYDYYLEGKSHVTKCYLIDKKRYMKPTKVQCPICKNNVFADVYEIDSKTELPTETGFYLSCDDEEPKVCNLTFEEGIVLNREVYKWLVDNNVKGF